jgi:hypothetical protein
LRTLSVVSDINPPLSLVVIASEAKQSMSPLVALWIASSLRSPQ